jgi:hypothetical protein
MRRRKLRRRSNRVNATNLVKSDSGKEEDSYAAIKLVQIVSIVILIKRGLKS